MVFRVPYDREKRKLEEAMKESLIIEEADLCFTDNHGEYNVVSCKKELFNFKYMSDRD